jgi:hypothetical protein
LSDRIYTSLRLQCTLRHVIVLDLSIEVCLIDYPNSIITAAAPQSSWAAHAANASAAPIPKPPVPGLPALRPVEAQPPIAIAPEMTPLVGTASHLANGLASSSSVAPSAGIFAQNSLLPVLEPSQAVGLPVMQTITQQLNASTIAQAQAAALQRTTVGPPPQQQQQQQQQQQLSAAHTSVGTASIHQLHQQQQQQQAMQQAQSHANQQSTSFSQQQSSYAANSQAQGRGGLTLTSDVQVSAARMVISSLKVILIYANSHLILFRPALPCPNLSYPTLSCIASLYCSTVHT